MDAVELHRNTVSDGYSAAAADVDRFVPATLGVFDFWTVPDDLADAAKMLPVPIRLANGRHFGSGGGFGIAHMLYNHGPALALWGYYSVQDYVLEVTGRADAVYAGRDGRHLLVRRREPALAVDRLLVVELSRDRSCYSVVTGWLASSRRPVNGTLIAERVESGGAVAWESRAPNSRAAEHPAPDTPQSRSS